MSFGPNIAPFRPASTTPPQTTWAFFRWAVEGAWPGILWATFWSAAAGSLEAISATLLGMTVAEVRNRATINGAIEIGRAPGVVQVTFLAPLSKLDAVGLGDYAREQYGL